MPNPPDTPDAAWLQKAVSKLAPIECDVLLLSARDGLRNDEIAVRLGLSPAAVERHLSNALCKLDRFLQRRQP